MNTKSKKKSKRRLTVGIIFGGRSAEHQVSLVSATSIMNALDKKKYRVVPIGITPDGRWLSSDDALDILKTGGGIAKEAERIILPDPSRRGLFGIRGKAFGSSLKQLDVVVPVLHGTFGEDGTIQGLLELAGIAYVGSGVLGSSAGMDKIITKQLCEQSGIPVVPYVWFLSNDYRRASSSILRAIEKEIRFPCFVKPANLGSSVGISKVRNRRELIRAIELATRYDRRILVEQGIEPVREIEVAVLGNDEPVASVPGEIISSNEFYDYDAKYVDGKSDTVIPARLERKIVTKIQEYSIRCFQTVDGAGMARVDFLVNRKSGAIYLNEINTIPGFTSISMYPKLWEESGIPYPALLDRLIELALERYRERWRLSTAFRPKSRWYQS